MNKIIIFGIGKISDVISYYFENNTKLEIVAYTVDDKYVTSNIFRGKPVIPFSKLEKTLPPDDHKAFVALGYQDLNKLRETKCFELKDKGYDLVSYIGKGPGISNDLIFQENCFVMDGALIHPNVIIGSNVFIWSGAMIGHHTNIEDNCWFTSCSNISGGVNIGCNAFFAVNSTVANSLVIGENCFFGANCLITKCVPDNSVFIEQSSSKFRLNSFQFLKISNLSQI